MAATIEKKRKSPQFIMSLAVDEDFSSRLDRFVAEMTRMGVKHSSKHRTTLNRTEVIKLCFDFASEATAAADIAIWAKARAERRAEERLARQRQLML